MLPQGVIWDHKVVLYKGKLQKPLLDDPHPCLRCIYKVPQVVIGDDNPSCFLCQVEQKPVIMGRNPLSTDLSGRSKGEQTQVFQLV